MKCKKCGHRTNTINAMRIHYLKKHPDAMKRRKSASTKKGKSSANSVISRIKRLLDEIA
jgi:ribosomal protein L34E